METERKMKGCTDKAVRSNQKAVTKMKLAMLIKQKPNLPKKTPLKQIERGTYRSIEKSYFGTQ